MITTIAAQSIRTYVRCPLLYIKHRKTFSFSQLTYLSIMHWPRYLLMNLNKPNLPRSLSVVESFANFITVCFCSVYTTHVDIVESECEAMNAIHVHYKVLVKQHIANAIHKQPKRIVFLY